MINNDKLEALVKWAIDRGAKIPSGIVFQDAGEDNGGIRCIAENYNGQSPIEVSIPGSLIISDKLASHYFQEYTVGDGDRFWVKMLLCKLKFDKSIQHDFGPYLDCLPKVVHSPLIWSPPEIKLLIGTNLGNSLTEKLQIIYEEWYTHVNNSEEFPKIEGTLHPNDLRTMTVDEIYDNLTSQYYKLEKVWYNFDAYLWSHLIFTSRAFPEYIVDPNSKPGGLILLPLIDLLNHDNLSNVEWSSNNSQNFTLGLYFPTSPSRGQELFNNYGAKGNEELLSGYGFVIEDNKCDSVILKLRLPENTIDEILNTTDLPLNTLEDYSTDFTGKYTDSKPGSMNKKNLLHGIVYLIEARAIEQSVRAVLNLFSQLASNGENYLSLRSQLSGIQSLRDALSQKLEKIPSNTLDCKEALSDSRMQMALIYRSSQKRILQTSIKILKSIEKKLIADHKDKLVTMKKVLKYDPKYIDSEIRNYLNLTTDPIFEYSEEFLTVWLLIKLDNKSFPTKLAAINDKYVAFCESCSNALNTQSYNQESNYILKKFFGNTHKPISIDLVSRICQFLGYMSFTRLTSQETIIVI